MIWTPYPYQSEMISWIRSRPDSALWAGCGTGKTAVVLTAIADMILDGECKGALYIAPFRILATSVPAQVARWDHLNWLRLANMRTPEGQQAWEDGSADVYLVNSELLPTITRNVKCRVCKGNDDGCDNCNHGIQEQVTRGFVEKFIRKRKSIPVDVLVVDECFPKGTLVDTPDGPVKIENLKKGDCVSNVYGEDSVVRTIQNEVFSAIKVRFRQGSFVCSPSHRLLTSTGWKAAGEIQVGDSLVPREKAMRLLWGRDLDQIEESRLETLQPVLRVTDDRPPKKREAERHLHVVQIGVHPTPPNPTESFLRDILFSEMAVPSFSAEADLCGRKKTQIREEPEVDNFGIAKREESDGDDHSTLSNEEPRISSEAEGYTQEDRASAPCAGRERKTTARTSENPTKHAGWTLGGGVCGPNPNYPGIGLPHPLQAGFSERSHEDRDRGGRVQPQFREGTPQGFEEREVSSEFRVESIEIWEQGDPRLEELRSENGRIYFYDIEVLRHPSYSVSGVLVHNCSTAKNPSSVRYNSLRPFLHDIIRPSGKNFKTPFVKRIGLTGTPHPNSHLDVFAQIRLLDGGKRLGSVFTRFRDAYFSSDYMGFKWTINDGAKEVIEEKLADIALVMRSEDYLDLPPCITEDIEVTLPAAAMKAYKTLEKDLLVELATGEIQALSAAALTTKLTQITSGQVLDVERNVHFTHSAKIDALKKLRKKHPKEPLLVFTSFIHEREQVLKEFPEARQFNEKDLPLWQKGKIPMWVSDARSLAFGVDGLQVSGRICVWMTQTYSWETFHQAVSRLVRTGQEQETLVYRVIATGTIDEAIVASVTLKEAGNAGLMAAMKALQDLNRQP